MKGAAITASLRKCLKRASYSTKFSLKPYLNTLLRAGSAFCITIAMCVMYRSRLRLRGGHGAHMEDNLKLWHPRHHFNLEKHDKDKNLFRDSHPETVRIFTLSVWVGCIDDDILGWMGVGWLIEMRH